MKAVKKYIVSTLVVLYSFTSFAQLKDSTVYISENLFNINPREKNIDSLFGIHFLYRDYLKLNLGNPGSATVHLAYPGRDFQLLGSGFFQPIDIPEYFISKRPVTSATYQLGTNKGQNLNVFHIQQLSPNSVGSIRYYRTHSEGFYQFQLNNQDRVDLSFLFKSRDKRYRLGLLGSYATCRRQENGGIVNDSSFQNDIYRNAKLYSVEMSTDKSYYYNWAGAIQQSFSLVNQSLFSLGVEHRFKYQYASFEYDGNPLNYYYSSILKDSIRTIDKSERENFQNQLGMYFWKDSVKFSVGLENNLSHYYTKDSAVHSTINGIYINAAGVRNTWYFSANGRFYFSGYNQSDYLLNGKIEKSFSGFVNKVVLKFENFSNHPMFNEQYYSGNYFAWSKSFKKIVQNKLELTAKAKNLAASLFVTQISNPVYFDTSSVVQQSASSYLIAGIKIDKLLSIGKHISLLFQGTLQHVNNDDVIRIPDFAGRAAVFYSGKLWSTSMNIGADVNYFSAYKANSYNPNLNSFYLQDSLKFGNYPMIGAFLEAKVKTVKVFFAMHHLNQGWFGNDYFINQNYTMIRRTFRLGITWNFYN